jgi:prolipoprotein diacylglyceryltransferase
MTSNPSRLSIQVLHNVATLLGALLVYYCFPITGESSPVWQVLLFSVGLGLLVWWIIRELRKQLTAGSNPRVGVHSLITLLYPVVALFALAYYLIQSNDPTQFDGISPPPMVYVAESGLAVGGCVQVACKVVSPEW